MYFSTFARYFFRSFTGKANIIISYYLVSRRLSTDPKYVTLNDLELPFSATESSRITYTDSNLDKFTYVCAISLYPTVHCILQFILLEQNV